MGRPSKMLLVGLLGLFLVACGTTVAQLPTPAPTPPIQSTAPAMLSTATTVPTTVPASPTVAATVAPTMVPVPTVERGGQPGGAIIFLAADGVTVQRMRSDGSDVQTLFTVAKPANATVTSLSASPDGTHILYSLYDAQQNTHVFLVENGTSHKLDQAAPGARWSPDGQRVLLPRYGGEGGNGPATLIYDVAQRSTMIVEGAIAPDWFPDGASLLYLGVAPDGTDNLFRYDLATQQRTQLTTLAGTNDDTWTIEEAHVLPGGAHITFYGGQQRDLDLSYNGMRWWWLPVAGGAPQPLTEPHGNAMRAYASHAASAVIAYAEHVHENICAEYETVVFQTSDVQGGIAASAPIPKVSTHATREMAHVKGLAWSPDGVWLALDVQRFKCVDVHIPETLDPSPVLFVWNTRTGNGVPVDFKQIGIGSFPVWVQQ